MNDTNAFSGICANMERTHVCSGNVDVVVVLFVIVFITEDQGSIFGDMVSSQRWKLPSTLSLSTTTAGIGLYRSFLLLKALRW